MVSCKSPEPRRPVAVSSKTFFNESVERNKLIFEKERKHIAEIIKNDSLNNYKASTTGFWYAYLKNEISETKKPRFGDKLSFTYDICDLNGKTIYSKSELGTQYYVMDKEELFSGLREGLKLMKTGEEIKFIFPSQKAYGYLGDNKRIGINVPIVCHVTLESIQYQ